MDEEAIIDLLSLDEHWVDPWARGKEDNLVNKPNYLYRYEGGYRMFSGCVHHRVKADYRVRSEFHRGAHP